MIYALRESADFAAFTGDHPSGGNKILGVAKSFEAAVTVLEIRIEFHAGDRVYEFTHDQNIQKDFYLVLEHLVQSSGIRSRPGVGVADDCGWPKDIDPEIGIRKDAIRCLKVPLTQIEGFISHRRPRGIF